MMSVNKLPLTWPTIMSDATLARMEHGKYVGVREESRRDGVCCVYGLYATAYAATLYEKKKDPLPL